MLTTVPRQWCSSSAFRAVARRWSGFCSIRSRPRAREPEQRPAALRRRRQSTTSAAPSVAGVVQAVADRPRRGPAAGTAVASRLGARCAGESRGSEGVDGKSGRRGQGQPAPDTVGVAVRLARLLVEADESAWADVDRSYPPHEWQDTCGATPSSETPVTVRATGAPREPSARRPSSPAAPCVTERRFRRRVSHCVASSSANRRPHVPSAARVPR